MNCVNTKHPSFVKLLEDTKLNTYVLEMRIAKWQEDNNTDEFPNVEHIKEAKEFYQLDNKNIQDSTPKEIVLNTSNTIESLKQLRLIQLSFEDDFARGVMIGERESQKNYLLKYLKSEKAVDYVINYAKENNLLGEQLEKVFLHIQANLLLNKQDYLQAINKFSQEADQKLDQKLKDFLKGKLNVNTVFDFNDYPGGVIAAADILNKQLTLFKEGKLDTIAEETGHFFFESISKENDIYFKLLDSVETWNGYSKVYEDYKNIYFTPNGEIDVDKIKREAIGQAIGQGIVRNFKAEEGNAFFKALQEVLDQIKYFLNLFKVFNFDVVIDDIAKEILNNDISRITKEYNSEGFEKKNAIDKSKYPIISKIIDGFKNINAKIVGSLSYREYGDLYREVDEDVHDIDVTIPYSQYKGDIQSFFNKIKEQFPDFKYNYRDKETKEIATWKDDYNDNIIYQIYIDDMPIDLFFKSPAVKEIEKGKKSWYDAFVVKYNYRRPKDMFDILNWANFEQTNLNDNPSVFYQKETIKPGVEELFNENPDIVKQDILDTLSELDVVSLLQENNIVPINKEGKIQYKINNKIESIYDNVPSSIVLYSILNNDISILDLFKIETKEKVKNPIENKIEMSKSILYSNKNLLETDLNILNERLKELEYSNISYKLTKNEDGTFNVNYFYESETSSEEDVDLLVNKLKKIFPQLKVVIIDEKDMGDFLDRSKLTEETWNSIPSFVIGDTVYLVKGRYTSANTIEELLHPFVNSLYLDNNELFNSLYEEALSKYSKLYNQIRSTYNGVYDVEDIKKEFLTQVLQQEYQQPKYSILSKFLNWLKGIINKLTDKLINVKDLKNLSLSQITMLIYDDNARIFMDSFENKVFYHIDDVLKSKIDTILIRNGVAKGSPQYNVVETIFKNQLVTFTEENHTYQDKDGKLYNSVTTVVKGKLDEQDPDYLKYKINRDWGTQLDYIAEQILLGLEIDRNKVKDLPENVIKDFKNSFSSFVASKTMEGSIILPQIVLNSKEDEVAGKPDYIVITKSGEIEVLDLKVSKNSAFSNSHEKTTYNTQLVDKNNKVIRLSTRSQHTVQVKSYAKMIENYGLPVKNIHTLHYKVDIKETLNENKEVVKQELQNISIEGTIDHNKSDYVDDRILAEEVIQTIQTEQSENDIAKREQRKVESGHNLLDKLNKLISDWEIVLTTKVIKSQNFKAYVAELSQFLEVLKEESDPEVVYTELLQFYNEKLAIRNESIQKMLNNNESITVNRLNIFKHYAEESDFIKSLLQQTELLVSNPYINTLALNLNESLEDFLDNYDTFRERHLKQALENNLQREYTNEEIKQLLNEAMPTSNDISTMSTWARRMVESGDAFLTLVDTLVKNQLQTVKDLMKTFQENVSKFANNVYLNHSGKKGEEFHYMLSKNKKGEITGHLIDNLDWYAYKETQDEYYKNCFDTNGKLRGLEEVDSSLTQEEQDEIKKRNIELWIARKKKREFDQEERVINGLIEDGEFHKYSQEFKDARDLLFKPYINAKYDTISWVKKDSATKKEVIAFYNKYYTTPVEYKSMIIEKGVPTGEIEYKEQRFPKKEFIEKVTTIENGLLNKDYVEIMSWENSSNKEQKAKYNFYVYYTSQMKELIKLIPDKQAHKLNGQIAKVKQRLMTEATVTMKGGWFSLFIDSIKSFFSLKSEASSVMVYSDNEIDQETLPILFVADFKSENLIKYLKYKKEFVNLSFSKKSKNFITNTLIKKGATQKQINSLFDLKLDLNEYKTYKFELAKVNKAIYLEESKISAGELETDLAKNLTVFAEMVYGYDAMNSIEGTIQLVKDKIKNKKYTVESSIGDKLKGKNSKEDAFVTGENSNAYKRLDSYLKMTYYKTSRPFDSKMGQIAKKLLSTMAVRSVGLNPFGQFNNYLIGKISNFIETNPFSKTGLYWNKSHINEADLEYKKSLIDFSNKLDQGPYKLEHLKTNKYDAIVEFFNMDRGYTPAGTYGQFSVKDQLTEKAFYMQQKIEYALQTKTGVSILMAKEIINSITGEKSSVYNAMEFNKKEGKVQFKEGFNLDKNDKYALTNFIYEVNASIHGNYAIEDKMAIQSSLLGELVSVYRKHIVPGYDQRFRKAYFNDVRGWQEGRYVTAQQFFLTILKLKDLRYTWDSLSSTQKINMQKNLTELSFIVATMVITGLLAAGADDDDSKLYNAFRVSIDKLNSEMLFYYPVVGIKQQAQFLKNPSAVLSYAGDIGDIFTAGIKTSLGDPYFKTGINKGELRLTKESMDVLPLLQLINKWQSFETVKSFYIK